MFTIIPIHTHIQRLSVMEDKSDILQRVFVDSFLYVSNDVVGDVLDAYLSIPIYINPDNKGIDKFNILW